MQHTNSRINGTWMTRGGEQRRKACLDESILRATIYFTGTRSLLFRIGAWEPRKNSLYWFITRPYSRSNLCEYYGEGKKISSGVGFLGERFISYASSRITLFLHPCSPIASRIPHTWRKSEEGKGDAVVPFRVRIVVDRFDKFEFHRMSKIKRIILIFETEENLRPLIQRLRRGEGKGDAVVPFIDSINLNFVLWKHTSAKNQTDNFNFRKIFDHLSKDCAEGKEDVVVPFHVRESLLID